MPTKVYFKVMPVLSKPIPTE